MDDEERQQTRFLIGVLALVGVLGCGGLLFWTPVVNLLMFWRG
jgi:ABC-type transporter Mla subunit MlaD